MKKIFIFLLEHIFKLLPLRNIILLESNPDLTDNTMAVFKELLRREWSKKYIFMWVIDKPEYMSYTFDESNVKLIARNSREFRYYYSYRAKYIITNNYIIPPQDERQRCIYVPHGVALKSVSNYYSLPDYCTKYGITTISDYLIPYDAKNDGCSQDCLIPLGFPRNDVLLNSRINLNALFNTDCDKFIYWMPTYRQHRSVNMSHSSISMPVIHDEQSAMRINEFARENKTFIIVKPHPAQDLTLIKQLNMSNIVFIDNLFLFNNNVDNYALLGSTDALLTDYSSVYYDYLLVDKPIGLCWEDFDEYNEREGFVVDVDYVMSGGVKIYNEEDFCSFLREVTLGKDSLADKRNDLKAVLHKYTDNQSSLRVVDYMEREFFK